MANEQSKKLLIPLLILVLAIIVGTILLVHGLKSDDDSKEAADATTTAAQTQTQEAKSSSDTEDTQTAGSTTCDKCVLKILLPESKYKDIEKFSEKYNAEDNRYLLEIIHTDTSAGIDPMEYDALIIPGGKHVHPSYYDAEVECDKHGFNPDLDRLEIDLVKAFVEAKKPILGVCRGCQLVNVALGGTLKQDVGMGHYKDAARETIIAENNDLRRIFGETVVTLHYHHQAVDQLADGLTVTMTDAEDGTIEGYVHETLPIYAYQFHPDRMYVKEDPDVVKKGRIFMEQFFDLVESTK